VKGRRPVHKTRRDYFRSLGQRLSKLCKGDCNTWELDDDNIAEEIIAYKKRQRRAERVKITGGRQIY
jgi:hypothetical protein